MPNCTHFTPDDNTAHDGLGKCQKITDYLMRGATTQQAEKVAREQLNGCFRTVHFTFLFKREDCNETRGCAKYEPINQE